MAESSYAIGDFRGGELSQLAQGRFDKPDYRTSLRVCINSFPLEAGPWTRRPGTMHALTTLNGAPGRVMRFDFEQAAPVTLEFTDANLRFRAGPNLISGTLATPYVGGAWASIRAVQAETTQILLASTVTPQALVATPGAPPTFALSSAIFNDGPYLDPFTNGVQATPSAKVGVIGIALAFPAYDATKAYAVGAFITSSAINYVSLVDQNVGNTPASSPAKWATTSVSAAINGGLGFLGTDIGRLVRLFSEPAAWAVATGYLAGNIVAYNPTGIAGATTYWQSLTSNTGKAPGTDLTNWSIIASGAAIWSWGKITSLSNAISPTLSGSASIGNMTLGGGNDAAFNGVFSQPYINSAYAFTGASGRFPPSTNVTFTTYVGKNYSGSAGGGQIIEHAVAYPSSNIGFAFGTSANGVMNLLGITFNLRAKASVPLSSSDGTLLGTVTTLVNNAPVTIISSDQTTSWAYVWIEEISIEQVGGSFDVLSYAVNNAIAQVSFFNPTGTGVASGVNVEILGPPLLYTNPVLTWRLGVYSNTTGWPSCGVYNDGRLYLGGAVGNRFDACVSNGVLGSTVNFAPTDQYGAVSDSSAISYTFNANGVNPILWMAPDLQGVLMGTQAGEWLVQAPTAGPISVKNITARNVTNHGSANIQPCRTEHTTIFVQRFARKLLEYFPDVFSGKFSAPNLADKTYRTRKGVAELAYTSAVTPIAWGRCNDGSLFGITYKRDSLASAQPPTFYGWHGHTLGSGRVVESICSGPSINGDLDALTMVTNDPATGIRHVEILTDTPDELTDLPSSWFLDDAVRPTVTLNVNGVTFGGLSHLEGKTIQIFAGGLDLGDRGTATPALADFVVTGAAVTVPYGDGVSAGPGKGLFTQDFMATSPPVLAGFTYTSDGQLARPIAQADTGARNGPGFGKLTRAHRYAFKLVNTIGLFVGDTFAKMNPANFKDDLNNPLPSLTMFTGISQEALLSQDAYDNSLCWRVTRPWPATIVIAGVNQSTKDQ